MKTYLRNLSLWLRGIRWLWTREAISRDGVWCWKDGRLFTGGEMICYKPGYGPWRFLPIYLTTYLAGTLAGYGVVSLSRAWFDRSQVKDTYRADVLWQHPFARVMTRLLDWIFPGSAHGRHTGPRLWGSINLRY